jgi:hypothetical protein
VVDWLGISDMAQAAVLGQACFTTHVQYRWLPETYKPDFSDMDSVPFRIEPYKFTY